MRVLLINGSPHEKRCTQRALEKVGNDGLLLELVRKRRSIWRYTKEKIPHSIMGGILKTAMFAPSRTKPY